MVAKNLTSCNEKRKNQSYGRTLRRTACSLVALACVSSIDGSEAFTFGKTPLHQHQYLNHIVTDPLSTVQQQLPDSRESRTTLMYAPPNHPTTKTAPMVAQAFYSTYKTNRSPTKPRNHQNQNGGLSNSVLSSSDTLPSFPTAHGLLSPETVIRMEIMTSSSTRHEAVDYFLRTYRKDGPMACLHLLSDPQVLPRLTEAMRDIIQ